MNDGDALVFTLPTAADTHGFGRRLAEVLRAGDLLILDGPLGAGKTAMAQGIGAGLGVQGRVASPTFVIARVHPAGGRGVPLVHVDAYRLGSVAEVDELDLDEYLLPGTELAASVIVVEWGAGLAEQLADTYLLVRISRTAESDVRTATLIGRHGDWATRLAVLADAER